MTDAEDLIARRENDMSVKVFGGNDERIAELEAQITALRTALEEALESQRKGEWALVDAILNKALSALPPDTLTPIVEAARNVNNAWVWSDGGAAGRADIAAALREQATVIAAHDKAEAVKRDDN